ncbi:hypothetical protein ACWFRB_01755 [Rhodococcus sp. NPDC055112]
MAATDTVSSAGNLFLNVMENLTRPDQENRPSLSAASCMSLIRAALESSSQAIWLLSPPDRSGRRARAIGMTIDDKSQQFKFANEEVGHLSTGTVKASTEEAKDYREATRGLQKEIEFLKTVEHEKVRSSRTTLGLVAEWINGNVPAHDSGELDSNDLSAGFKRVYATSSGIIHGYQWVTDHTRDGDLFGLLADGFAAAVNLTECAVALYEAQSINLRDPGARERLYPELLEPTIQQWAKLYQ